MPVNLSIQDGQISTYVETPPLYGFYEVFKAFIKGLYFPLLAHLCLEILFRNGQITPNCVTHPSISPVARKWD